MKKLIILSFLLPFIAFSQDISWTTSSQNGETLRNMDTDKDGNVYSIGDYPVSGNSMGMGGFINKFDKNGNLLWEHQLQVNRYFGVHGRDVKTDSEGNCIAGFTFTDTLHFLGHTFIPIEDFCCRRGSTLILKFNPAGNIIWYYIILRGGLSARPKSIILDEEDNVYVQGGIYDYINFPDTTYYAETNANRFLLKLGKNGNYLWAKHSNCLYFNRCKQKIISIEGFKDSIIIDDNIFYKQKEGGFLLFCADLEYHLIWAKLFQYESGGFSLLNKTTDKQGNIFLTGFFEKDIMYENDTVLRFQPQYSGQNNYAQAFIIKIDSSGNFLWSRTGHSPDPLLNEGITVDTAGHVFITGFFNKQITFESITVYCSNPNARTMFITKYDKDGNLIWLTNAVGSSSVGTAMAADNDGNVYFGGGYIGTVNFGSHSVTGSGIMVGKIAGAAMSTAVQKFENKEEGALSIFPNPANNIIHINYKNTPAVSFLQLEIKNAAGQTVYRENYNAFNGELKDGIDLSKQAKGIYFIEIIADKKREVKRIVLD